MISSSREAKQEGDTSKTGTTLSPSSSRAWSAYRNPRIVRVSRALGGKDRHSKVFTIRGLRDRRIRLSVQTAIQLYDLQDRLGLNQPSKVIDWLIQATKDDIDKLPQLQLPPGFGQFHHPFHHPMILPHDPSQCQLSSINGPNPFFDVNGIGGFHNSLGIDINAEDRIDSNVVKSRYGWDQEAEASLMTMRGSKSGKEIEILSNQKGKWPMRANEEQENRISDYNIGGAQMFFPVVSNSDISSRSSSASLHQNPMPFNSSYHQNLDRNFNSNSSLSLSQFSSQEFGTQTENSSLNNNNMSINALSLPNPSVSSGPQLFFCSPMSIPSLCPPYNVNSNSSSIGSESREINNLQVSNHSPSKPSLPRKDVDIDS